MRSVDWDDWATKYVSNTRGGEILSEILNGETGCMDLSDIVSLRIIAEGLVPNSTRQGISKIYIRNKLMTSSRELNCDAEKYLQQGATGANVRPWARNGNRSKGVAANALPVSIDLAAIEAIMRAELKKYPNGFPQGYCLPGGIVGL